MTQSTIGLNERLDIPCGPPVEVIREDATVTCRFNVMPGRDVAETLLVREYRIWNGYVEATFDRSYLSAMTNSPSHLVMLTALAHSQKAAYLAMCRHFGRTYRSGEDEFCKFWWTEAHVEIPKLVRKEKDLLQRTWLTEMSQLDERTFCVGFHATFCDSLTIRGRGPMYLV